MTELADLSGDPFCYLTTRGRASGHPHTIEIWFALVGSTLYMLSGGGRRSDWVRNLERDPEVSVRIRDLEMPGTARVVEDPEQDAEARRLVHDKYARGSELEAWRDRATPVAVDLST